MSGGLRPRLGQAPEELGAVPAGLPSNRLPRPDVPPWVKFLVDAAVLAALRPLDPPRRFVVVLPTAEAASAVLTTGAVSALANHRTRNPIDVDLPEPGARISAFYSGLYCDTTLVEVTEEGVRLPRVLLTRNLDVIRPLPEMFPGERADRRLKTESQLVAAWQLATDAGHEAMRVHARVSAEPVIVLGHRSDLLHGLALLDPIWPIASSFLDCGQRLDQWFRHPVLVVDPRTEVRPWAREVRPSLIVCDGAAAWRSNLRFAFPDAAHVLVLDRRTDVAAELSDDLRASKFETLPFAPQPPDGVEAWRIHERFAGPAVDPDEDEF